MVVAPSFVSSAVDDVIASSTSPTMTTSSSVRSMEKNRRPEETAVADLNWPVSFIEQREKQQYQGRFSVEQQRQQQDSFKKIVFSDDRRKNRTRSSASSSIALTTLTNHVQQIMNKIKDVEEEDVDDDDDDDDEGEKVFLLQHEKDSTLKAPRSSNSTCSTSTNNSTTTTTTTTTNNKHQQQQQQRQQQEAFRHHPNPNLIHSTFDCHRQYNKFFQIDEIPPIYKEESIGGLGLVSNKKVVARPAPIPKEYSPQPQSSEIKTATFSDYSSSLSEVSSSVFNNNNSSRLASIGSTCVSNSYSSSSIQSRNHYPSLTFTNKKNRKRKKKKKNQHGTSSSLKWTKDNIFWLRFWSQQREQLLKTSDTQYDDYEDDDDYSNDLVNGNAISSGSSSILTKPKSKLGSSSSSAYSYCYYNFFYYPFRTVTSSNTTNVSNEQTNLKFSSSLTTLLPPQTSSCFKIADFTGPKSLSSLSTTGATVAKNNSKSPLLSIANNTTWSSSVCHHHQSTLISCSDDRLDQTSKRKFRSFGLSGGSLDYYYPSTSLFEEYYNCYLPTVVEESQQHRNSSNSSSPLTICLSTIMEILPLVLLLTMGVIISTTCAKYTFKSSMGLSSQAPSSSSGHTMFNSTSTMIARARTQHSEPKKSEDDHLNLMMADEEAPDLSGSGGPRPHFAMFHGTAESTGYYHSNHPSSPLSSSSSSSASSASSSASAMKASSSAGSASSSSGSQTSQQQLFVQLAHQYSAMHLRWLSNSSVTCNDGTRAGYYIRPSPTASRRWLIFLEGGWYCMSKSTCDQRWYKMRDFMTSFRWSQYKTFSGILSSSPSVNPYWWNANHVFIPYCSSDIWSGDSPQSQRIEMAFLGSRIIDEVIGELIHTPSYQFVDAKFVLLAGSSAGAAGVMINLDRVAKMIADAGSMADVRGLADSGWIMDNDQPLSHTEEKISQFGSSSSKYNTCADGNCSPTETIKGAYRLWNSRVPEACAQRYPQEPWRCYFGYRLYPTLSTPLFVVQFQYDEFQIYMDGMTSHALNDMEKMRYIRSLSQHMTSTLANVSAVFVPSCMAHILLTKLDWHKVAIHGITLPEALNCWEQTPVNHNHNRYHRYHHHHHHHRTPVNYHQPNLFSNSNTKLSWTAPLEKQVRYMPSQTSGSMVKTEYLAPNGDQNELSQFYSPSSSTSSSGSSSNFLNYLTLKQHASTLNHNATFNHPYSHQQIYSGSGMLEVEEKMPKLFKWKLNDSNTAIDVFAMDLGRSNSISDINQTAESTTKNHNESLSQHPQTSVHLSQKKKKKRKRRKGHHHRKSSGNSTPASTTKTVDSMIQNDGYHQYSPNLLISKSSSSSSSKLLNSYYQSLGGSSNSGGLKPYASTNMAQQTTYWSKQLLKQQQQQEEMPSYSWNSDHHHYHHIRVCHFRLIDDHQYPERNRDCPRLQFNQQNQSNNRDNSSYMERRR